MKIQLIHAINSANFLARDKWMAPLNLLSLSTYLEQRGYDIEILDGAHINQEEILRRLDGEIVGINFNICSTNQMEEISEQAKNNGSLVVVGGHEATSLSRQILNKNRNVDLVVRYDGEEALKQIAERVKTGKRDFRGIPNTTYRRGGEIIEERTENLEVEILPTPDRTSGGIHLEDYISAFDKEPLIGEFIEGRRTTNAQSIRGCNNACSFCGRIYKNIRTRNPEQVYEEDKMLVQTFGIDYIYETADNFFADHEWLKTLAEVYRTKGKLPVRYWALSCIEDITPETVKIMNFLNVEMVGVGIESGSEEIRRKNGKNFTNEDIFRAARLLQEAGIKLQDNYLLGLIGESEETVKKTHSLAEDVSRYCDVSERRGFHLILPTPGSPIWRRMMQVPELKAKYGEEYKFDIEELRKDYLAHFCNL